MKFFGSKLSPSVSLKALQHIHEKNQCETIPGPLEAQARASHSD